MKIFTATIVFIALSFSVLAGNKMKFFFNHPVDTTVSIGVNATYLNNCIDDTLVAYINRSKYTLDIAVYNYVQGTTANIATAVNNAYNRGVIIRWIHDGSSSNSGLALLNIAIPTLASPTTSAYTIMHNKFVVIDGNSSDPNDAIVWTGSTNWDTEQFNTDYNNVVVIQDSALAHAYIAEFNMMWGGAGTTPNASLSKFGPYKTNLGLHSFYVEGNYVELYFSPSDGTETHIQSTIATANTDLYFGMYTFTSVTDANMIVSKYDAGVYVSGIDDNFSHTYTPYSIFTSGLGSHFIEYNGTGIFHNKYLIVDPSDKCSDPMILTGSHNWSTSANTKNDENTLIIHNDTAANIYYQSFRANFLSLGGTLSIPNGCPSITKAVGQIESSFEVFPNPSTGLISIRYFLTESKFVTIEIYDLLGRKIETVSDNELQAVGQNIANLNLRQSGVYIVKARLGDDGIFTRMITVEN